MLLIITGAGASWDSVPGAKSGDRYRPPLAKSLFDQKPDYVELLNDFPHAAPIVSRVRMALEAGIGSKQCRRAGIDRRGFHDA